MTNLRQICFRWRENELYIDYVEQTAGKFLFVMYIYLHTVMGRVKRLSMGFTHLLSKIVTVVTMQSMVVSVKWSANTSFKN